MNSAATNWATQPLSEVAKIERNSVPPEKIKGGTLYVGLENITGEGQFNEVREVANGELASNKFSFTPHHVLYGKLRPYLSKIARPEFSGICSTDILPILAGDKVDRSFLYYFLRQPKMVQHATTRSTGANLPRLSPTQLAKFPIPLPPLAEQKRIAAILDKADTIRRKRQEAEETTDALEDSVFLDLVGPGAESYEKWEPTPIESLAKTDKGSMRTGPFGSNLLHSEFVDEGIAVLGIDNAVKNRFAWDERRYISKTKYEELKRYTVYPNDVIITIMGTIGRSAVVPSDIPTAITTKHIATITLNREQAEPEFVSQSIFRHPYVAHQLGLSNRGAIMAGLNLGLIKKIKLPLPPIELQSEFVRRVKSIRKLREKLTVSSKETDDLFNSLVQRAFKGKL